MPDENFDTTLLRLTVASIYASVAMQVGREMFGKGYFLAPAEKTASDQAALAMVMANFQALTEEGMKKLLGASAALLRLVSLRHLLFRNNHKITSLVRILPHPIASMADFDSI